MQEALLVHAPSIDWSIDGTYIFCYTYIYIIFDLRHTLRKEETSISKSQHENTSHTPYKKKHARNIQQRRVIVLDEEIDAATSSSLREEEGCIRPPIVVVCCVLYFRLGRQN